MYTSYFSLAFDALKSELTVYIMEKIVYFVLSGERHISAQKRINTKFYCCISSEGTKSYLKFVTRAQLVFESL